MSEKPRSFAFALIGLLVVASGCTRTIEIEYVFPNGFRGAAVIRENQPNGIPPCKLPALAGINHCVLNFPSTGVLNIQGDSPGTVWHTSSARYTNGMVIPVPYNTPGAHVSKETIALWTFGGVQYGEDWLFVGTEDEFRKFRDEKHSNK